MTASRILRWARDGASGDDGVQLYRDIVTAALAAGDPAAALTAAALGPDVPAPQEVPCLWTKHSPIS
ncbi:MAG TPA: hypothetical protein VHW23_03345 [Kofleriaceae bacterium]|nr:hypothetical protein [Kofleriaceae bacterium]